MRAVRLKVHGAPLDAAYAQHLHAVRERVMSLELDVGYGCADPWASLASVLPLFPALRQLCLDHIVILPENTHAESVMQALHGVPARWSHCSCIWRACMTEAGMTRALGGQAERDGAVPRSWSLFAAALGSATHLKCLRSLELCFQHAGDIDVPPIAPAVASLTHLLVSWDRITPEGVTGLQHVLAACSDSLTSLELPFCYNPAPNQLSLPEILAACPQLQQLQLLSRCACGTTLPSAADVQALGQHRSLRSLVICGTCAHSSQLLHPPHLRPACSISTSRWRCLRK